MINAYIITEEGRVYSDEGVKYVLESINKFIDVNSNEDGAVMLAMGEKINDRKYLAKELAKNPNFSIIVVSMPNSIFFITPDDIPSMIEALNDYEYFNNHETSFKVFSSMPSVIAYDEECKNSRNNP